MNPITQIRRTSPVYVNEGEPAWIGYDVPNGKIAYLGFRGAFLISLTCRPSFMWHRYADIIVEFLSDLTRKDLTTEQLIPAIQAYLQDRYDNFSTIEIEQVLFL